LRNEWSCELQDTTLRLRCVWTLHLLNEIVAFALDIISNIKVQRTYLRTCWLYIYTYILNNTLYISYLSNSVYA
jgi:hypothetical protein